MDEKNLPGTPATESVRNLNWVDLTAAVFGIIVFFVILIFATQWAAYVWPHKQALMYLNGFLTQASFFLLIWGLKKIRKWKWSDFGWRPVNIRKALPTIFSLYLLTWVINITYAFYLYNHGLTPPTDDVYTQLFGHSTLLAYLLNIILASVLAPLLEETLFRGIIFKSLQAHFGKRTSAILSSALFSGLHFQLYGFIPRFILGLILTYIYDRYKSLYPSMTFHALNNFVATVLMAGAAP